MDTQYIKSSLSAKRLFFPRLFLMALFLLMMGSNPVWAGFKKEIQFDGKTMGTTYKIKYLSSDRSSKSAWQKKVEIRLKQVNQHLSMYDPDSEITAFNKGPLGIYKNASDDFFTMVETGRHLYALSNGAWDGTIKPLVDLWGFGTRKQPDTIPSNATISEALLQVGFGHIQIQSPRQIIKNKSVTLDFGSIAKGYGVDAIARLFRDAGITNVLVEIGGELYASGKNKKGKLWTVGISRPDPVLAKQSLYKILRLNNQAIATSGNYRNFYTIEGRTFSHIIDPKTGYPVQNRIVSASVIAKDCTMADGLATALMVMDVQGGLDLINSLDGVECLIVRKKSNPADEKKPYTDYLSDGFQQLVVNPR